MDVRSGLATQAQRPGPRDAWVAAGICFGLDEALLTRCVRCRLTVIFVPQLSCKGQSAKTKPVSLHSGESVTALSREIKRVFDRGELHLVSSGGAAPTSGGAARGAATGGRGSGAAVCATGGTSREAFGVRAACCRLACSQTTSMPLHAYPLRPRHGGFTNDGGALGGSRVRASLQQSPFLTPAQGDDALEPAAATEAPPGTTALAVYAFQVERKGAGPQRRRGERRGFPIGWWRHYLVTEWFRMPFPLRPCAFASLR